MMKQENIINTNLKMRINQRINQFEIIEITKTTGAKIGIWQVRQLDKQERGSYLRKEFSYPINNAPKKEEALENAKEYAKKAVPYD